MDCKVIWAEPAFKDLGEIVRYIAADDAKAAKRVGYDIINSVEVLGRFPFIGPTYPLGSSGKVREIVSWNYRIFYRVTPQKRLVEILRIWHGARGTPPIRA